MGWATEHIRNLKEGKTVSFRPVGNSMSGKIESGQLVTVVPVTRDTVLECGDIVLCRVKNAQYLHIIKTITPGGGHLIGNNKGRTNGYITREDIFGVLTEVKD